MKTPNPRPRKPAAKKTATTSKPAVAKKTAAPKKPRAPRVKVPVDPILALVQKTRSILEGKKGENIVTLRVTEVSSVTDYLLLCTGLNGPHLRALADETARQLRLETPSVACHRRAGSPESGWLVLDYLQFVVHIFTPEMREYYALERLWKDAPVIP